MSDLAVIGFWTAVRLLWDYRKWKFPESAVFDYELEHESGIHVYADLAIALRSVATKAVIYRAGPVAYIVIWLLCRRLLHYIPATKNRSKA